MSSKVKTGCQAKLDDTFYDIFSVASTTEFTVDGSPSASGSVDNVYCTDFNSGQVELNEATPVAATGGTITYSDSSGENPRESPSYPNGYTIHTFTASSTFTVTSGGSVEYLVVAGGGGGGGGYGGGGGAGGFRTGTGFVVTAQDYSIAVGVGGVGTYGVPTNGSDSVFSTITSIGGGSGGSRGGTSACNGGSGGGANGASTPGDGTVGQGNNGATGYSEAGKAAGGGGGGADEVGEIAPGALHGGDGGDGKSSSISGSSVTYAGGGGGGLESAGTIGVGGLGGGGDGSSGVGESGTANTGGGGGGGGNLTSSGGSGGSGIVIIRYLTYDADAYSTDQYYIVNTTDTNQLNTTNWTDIDSGTITETLNSQTAHYSVSFDDRTTWKVFGSGESTWRSIAKDDSGTWKYNSNATYGSETWTSASTNSQ
ncbi:MAG: hypothetical protein JRC90_12135, partial [Deltaproteobacteria bacterium]|nr:hypothetical protein [Deltaproteobacteria bacterium]